MLNQVYNNGMIQICILLLKLNKSNKRCMKQEYDICPFL